MSIQSQNGEIENNKTMSNVKVQGSKTSKGQSRKHASLGPLAEKKNILTFVI
jgi:hypothetical protein